jgi:hypothetical protein
MAGRFVNQTATIAAGQSLSGVIDCTTGAPVFLHMPANWDDAVMSFKVSPDGVNFNDLFETDAQELTYNIRAGTSVRLDLRWSPITFLKIRSGARMNPVIQEADRAIVVTIDTAVQTSPVL